MLCDQKQSRLDWGCRARDVEKNERNATSVGTAAATGVAAATGKKSHPPPERRQPMIRHSSPSAKKKKKISIPAASWPTINRNRPQQPRSSANFWLISLSMKMHPPCWNPTAANWRSEKRSAGPVQRQRRPAAALLCRSPWCRVLSVRRCRYCGRHDVPPMHPPSDGTSTQHSGAHHDDISLENH